MTSRVPMEKAFAVWPQVEPTLRVELLDRLTDEVSENENHPRASMMEVLGVLIGKYEDECVMELA